MALALALDIISDYHGPVVYIVAQTLSLHGALTLGELQRKIRERSSSTIATVTDIDFFHDRSDLEKTTTLSPESVQSALVILIRYAIVHMRLKSTTALYGEFIVFIDDSENLENRSGNKFVSHRCQYFLSERHALMMLRIPRMIEHTKHKIGVKEGFMVEELLVRGAETKSELIEGLALRVALRNDDAMYEALKADFLLNRKTAKADYYEEPLPNDNTSDETLLKSCWAVAAKDIFQEVFEKLVMEDILIPCQPFAVKTTAEDESTAASSSVKAKTKSTRKRKRTVSAVQTVTSADPVPKQKTAPSSNPPGSLPLTQSLELRVMLERAKLAKPQASSSKGRGNRRASKSRKSKAKESIEEAASEGAADSIVSASLGITATTKSTAAPSEDGIGPNHDELWWRVNPSFFLQAFRIDMISRFVVEKSGEAQMGIFPLTFYKISYRKRGAKGSRLDSDFDLPERSKAVSRSVLLRQLMPALSKSYAGQEEAVFDVYTKLLSQDPSNIVTYEEDGNGGLLTCNFAEIAEGLKWRCILRIIEQQHGKKGARIIRLLEARGALEEKQIGDLVMMPRKEARSKLYSLLKNGLVVWEEAPRRTDFLPSQVYHLWSTNKEKIMTEFVQSSYKAMLNMRIRYRALSQYNKELDRFVQYEDEVASGQMTQEEMLKVPGIEKYHRYRLAFDKLDRAMLDLDLTCMLLDHF